MDWVERDRKYQRSVYVEQRAKGKRQRSECQLQLEVTENIKDLFNVLCGAYWQEGGVCRGHQGSVHVGMR